MSSSSSTASTANKPKTWQLVNKASSINNASAGTNKAAPAPSATAAAPANTSNNAFSSTLPATSHNTSHPSNSNSSSNARQHSATKNNSASSVSASSSSPLNSSSAPSNVVDGITSAATDATIQPQPKASASAVGSDSRTYTPTSSNATQPMKQSAVVTRNKVNSQSSASSLLNPSITASSPTSASTSNQSFPSPATSLQSSSTSIPALASVLQIGNKVHVQLSTEESCVGVVFMFDAALNILAIEEYSDVGNLPSLSSTSRRRDITLINTTHAQIRLVSKGDASVSRSYPLIDDTLLKVREEKALYERSLEVAKLGKNVSVEGQRLFDVLEKSHPVHWENNVIVIMNSLKLSPPFDANCISGGTQSQQQRIIRIIESEKLKRNN